MIQYSPEPTPRMKEWLRNKECTSTKALGQSSMSSTSSSSQTTLNLSTKDTQATVSSCAKDTQATVSSCAKDTQATVSSCAKDTQATVSSCAKDTQATVSSCDKDTQTTVALPCMDNKYWAIIEKKGMCGLCHQEVHKKMHRMPQGAGYVHSSCFWKSKFKESQKRLLALEGQEDPANVETQVYRE